MLWKLIEKKFQDLGEFVEGKERLKMVVHKVYKSTKELFSMFQTELDTFDDEDDDFVEDMMNELISDEELEQEMLSLGEMETKMVKGDEIEDEDTPAAEGDEDRKPSSIDVSRPSKKEDRLGKSEEAAITLSSGEDSEGGNNVASLVSATASPTSSSIDVPLMNCRMYRMVFPGPSIGVDIFPFNGRIVVDNVGHERRQRLGPNCKPETGDVFVSIGNVQCPVGWSLPIFRQYMKMAFARPPVTVIFAEVPQIKEQFLRYREQTREARRLASADASEVIEINDSDDS